MSPDTVDLEPVTRSHVEAQRAYDRLSRVYDRLLDPLESAPRRAGLRLLGVRAGEQVLEIGHGTGRSLVTLARQVGRSGSVIGVDLSPGMERTARERLHREGVDELVSLTRSDAVALPGRDASFDAVFMSYVLELFEADEIPLVLGEASRVLRPGGRLGVVALGMTDPPGLAGRLYRWAHRRFPRIADCRPIPTRSFVAQAGFRIETATTTSIWRLPIDLVIAARR